MSHIGVIHDNSIKWTWGYKVCYIEFKAVLCLDKECDRECDKDVEPNFLKQIDIERRIISLALANIFHNVQAFLGHKKGTKMKKKDWFGPKICCFLANCYQKPIFVYSDPLKGTKQGDQWKLGGHSTSINKSINSMLSCWQILMSTLSPSPAKSDNHLYQ